jgi:coxsackievirus/adenovirus receptor
MFSSLSPLPALACLLCATLNSPVCGSDGVTYSSKCEVQSKNCREQINLTIAYSGKCDEQCQTFCTFEYAPVCGTDGQTHSSECTLKSKACRERSDVTVAYQGECGPSGPSVRVPNLGPGKILNY